ncbi:fatty acid hydroxylase superfamily-domain-containing protein [Chlamydoabsidia padenii]|nr:fatty acid hydroxylase superfamily-domain-containing protein [Chlamydoabsidia padenii]
MDSTISQFKQRVTRTLPDMWTDEMMALWVPIAVYWIQCSLFEILMRLKLPFFEKYRIHSSFERYNRNRVSFIKVLYMVALQHVLQFVFGYFLLKVEDPVSRAMKASVAIQNTAQWITTHGVWNAQVAQSIAWVLHTVAIPSLQFVTAMFMIDTHQYVLHRLGHTSKFLYKHFHSHHHRLYVPYAFGALYNHPVEGFCLDTLGAGLAYELTGMSPRLGLILFTFSNLKTINDHCGYSFPWDPLNVCFGNNGTYHDIHHQPWGIKKNFSQPFFTFWDRKLGTEFDANELKKRTALKSS